SSDSHDQNIPPSLTMHISDDRPDAGQQFTLRLEANDDDGVSTFWWWATDTSDQELRNTHSVNCRGASPCRQTWQLSTADIGEIEIHAVARDLRGAASDELTDTIRVRRVTPTPTATPTR